MRGSRLKQELRDLLRAGDLEAVAARTAQRRLALGLLVALTFDPDPLVAWRAVEAMGLGVKIVGEEDPSSAREHMRRLYWLITEESGGVFWKAPECMAECAAMAPEALADYIPIAFHLLETLEEEDLEHFRPGALWAVWRLAPWAGLDLPAMVPRVVESLRVQDPQARGMAVWCLGGIGEASRLLEFPALRHDEASVVLYRNRCLETLSVAELTRRVLDS